MTFDEELEAAARALHREWQSPALWSSIAAEIAAIERAERNARLRRRRWHAVAAAAAVVLAVSAWFAIRSRPAVNVRDVPTAMAGSDPLLSEEALSQVERAEAQYIAAIEALAVKAAAASKAAEAPVLAHLRERLLVIDTAIADCRIEIERNRFNTHLRRQLLTMYQEKRRTLEEILKQEPNAS